MGDGDGVRMKDDFTEFMMGEPGAIRVTASIVLRPIRKENGITGTAIWGQILSRSGHLVRPENEGYNEMWDCEIIIIPKRKYSAWRKGDKKRKNPKYTFQGWRADQMLTFPGVYDGEKHWGEKYFDSSKL